MSGFILNNQRHHFFKNVLVLVSLSDLSLFSFPLKYEQIKGNVGLFDAVRNPEFPRIHLSSSGSAALFGHISRFRCMPHFKKTWLPSTSFWVPKLCSPTQKTQRPKIRSPVSLLKITSHDTAVSNFTGNLLFGLRVYVTTTLPLQQTLSKLLQCVLTSSPSPPTFQSSCSSSL